MTSQDNHCYKIAKTVSGSAREVSFNTGDAKRPQGKSNREEATGVQWSVYNREGARKYLTSSEMNNFLNAARDREEIVFSFCWIIAVTGCRISEALSLTSASIDFEEEKIVIRSLKKRGKRIFRAIPLPSELAEKLKQWIETGILSAEHLWPWSRMTGYRRICEVMQAAGVKGSHATPKGLRHGFAVKAVQANVPLNLVQRWLGHADIKTTAIYTNAMGPEEREFASRIWTDSAAKRSKRVRRRTAAGHLDRQAQALDAGHESVPEPCLIDTTFDEKLEVTMITPKVAEPGSGSRFLSLDSVLSCRLIQFWLFGLRIGGPNRRFTGGRSGSIGGAVRPKSGGKHSLLASPFVGDR